MSITTSFEDRLSVTVTAGNAIPTADELARCFAEAVAE